MRLVLGITFCIMLLLSASTAKPNENRNNVNVEAQHSFNASDKNEKVHFRSKRSFVSDAWVKIKSFVGVETLSTKCYSCSEGKCSNPSVDLCNGGNTYCAKLIMNVQKGQKISQIVKNG